MTIGRLRKEIEGLADDVVIVAPSTDHSLMEVECSAATGLKHGHVWTRDYGEDMTPESEHGKRLPVLVVCSNWT